MLSLSDIVNVKVGIGRGVFEAPGATVIGGKKPSFNLEILKLFANGEQGFWYDPNDLSTMFQDAAGTVPVTGVGQPVGLVLDKSRGLKLGGNLVLGDGKHEGTELYILKSDGNEAVSELNLNTVNPLSGSKDVRFKLTSGAGGLRPLVSVRLSENPVVGNFYHFSFKYKVLSGEAKIMVYHTGLGTSTINQTLTGEGVFKLLMPYLGTGVERPTLYFGDSLFDMQMDDFEYRRIQGNHAYQTTSASRPILRQNAVTGAYYLDFDGADDFFVTNSIDFTATNKLSLFTGVQKMPATTVNMLCELSSSSTEATQANAFYLAVPETSVGTVFFRSRATVLSGQIAKAESGSGMRNCVITAKSDIPNDLNTVSIDGVLGTPATTDLGVGNLGNYPLYIGRRGGTSFPFKGHLYSLIGIGRLTTGAETAALEKLIAKNTGVTLSV